MGTWKRRRDTWLECKKQEAWNHARAARGRLGLVFQRLLARVRGDWGAGETRPTFRPGWGFILHVE